MSDRRRTDLSQSNSNPRVSAARTHDFGRWSGIRKRLPYYAAALTLGLCVLAWIDGGEEPLHPITQSVELAAPAGGA